jgi:uncharacterized protein (DUF2236 family)
MRLGPPQRPTRIVDLLNPAAVLLPAANVIMQLSSPGVGYGVVESPVDSGNVYRHPFKRARTTGTYLAAATMGTDSDRALIRAEVDKVHAMVRSNASSPLSYNAFDPKLQLWVAACLYRYYVDMHEFLYGPLDDVAADAVYDDAKRLGTTLQVRIGTWPVDRAAFDEYWKRSLDQVRIDPPVREHLLARAPSTSGRAPQPLRDDGLPACRVSGAHVTAVVRRPATEVRPAAARPSRRRSRHPARALGLRLPDVSVGHARPRTPRQASRLTRLPGALDRPYLRWRPRG